MPNAKSLVTSLATIVEEYAVVPLIELYSIGVTALILNCAPATGSLTPSGSYTTALSVTVSPGLAVTVSSSHTSLPLYVTSSSTMIAPSVSFTLSVISSPFVSLMNASDHFTGYVPPAVPLGTV